MIVITNIYFKKIKLFEIESLINLTNKTCNNNNNNITWLVIRNLVINIIKICIKLWNMIIFFLSNLLFYFTLFLKVLYAHILNLLEIVLPRSLDFSSLISFCIIQLYLYNVCHFNLENIVMSLFKRKWDK